MFTRQKMVRAGSKAVLLFTLLAGSLVAPLSRAQAAPALDGNIDDVILLANQNIANGPGAGILIQDPAKDICFTDTLFLPCDGVYQTSLNGCRYYANGFDIKLVALAVVGDQVWLGMRVSGNIADTDGDGTDSAGVDCPARSSGRMPDDPSGIADGENYRFLLDVTCEGLTDYIVSVHGGAGGAVPVVSVTDGGGVTTVPLTSAQARFAGTDLEVRLQGMPLPRIFSLRALAGSTFSGMSFDDCGPVRTNAPTVNALVDLAPADSFALGQPKWVSLHLTNQSPVAVAISALDVLPSDWQFTGNWSGDLPLESAQGNRLIFTSPELSAESTAVVRFEVAAQRRGVSEQNRALAYVSYQSTCLSEPLTALTDTVRGQWVASPDSSTTAASQAEHSTLLGSASPNPFRTSTRIWFTLGGSEAGHVRVCLYDAAGRTVRTLIDGSRAPGRYEMTWDGRRDDGSSARGGVYFAQAWVGERRLSTSSRVLYLR